jgi:hypothetical protein
MESNGSKKLALWMDQSHALLLSYQDKQALLLEELSSPIRSHVRIPGEGSDLTRFGSGMGDASNNEKRKNNIHQQQLKEYFGQLEKKVATATNLLLLGPGVVKTQFFHYLQEQKHFATLKMKVLDADKMTHNQLQALVRESYLTAI